MGWGSCDGSYLSGTIHANSISLSFNFGVCWGVGLRDIKPVAKGIQLFSISQYMFKKRKEKKRKRVQDQEKNAD